MQTLQLSQWAPCIIIAAAPLRIADQVPPPAMPTSCATLPPSPVFTDMVFVRPHVKVSPVWPLPPNRPPQSLLLHPRATTRTFHRCPIFLRPVLPFLCILIH